MRIVIDPDCLSPVCVNLFTFPVAHPRSRKTVSGRAPSRPSKQGCQECAPTHLLLTLFLVLFYLFSETSSSTCSQGCPGTLCIPPFSASWKPRIQMWATMPGRFCSLKHVPKCCRDTTRLRTRNLFLPQKRRTVSG